MSQSSIKVSSGKVEDLVKFVFQMMKKEQFFLVYWQMIGLFMEKN